MAYVLAAALLLSSLTSDNASTDETPAEAPASDVVDQAEAAPAPAVVLSPRSYLYASYPGIAPRMDCVIRRESGWDPDAKNPRSSAGGLAQILDTTWMTTPQGKRGESRFNAYSNIDGAAWLAMYGGGWRHWTATVGGC
jgi:soluble lytic murein transglycosylase-like protein